jgi:glycosyltransferase involved in cell wall biosynthesis
MRIGINGSFWDKPNTGSGQYLRSLLPALTQCAPENEFAVIVPGRIEERAVAGIPAQAYFRSEPVALSRWSENLAKVWFEQVAFRRACQRERVALAHIPYFASPLFPPTRTVVTIHDLIPLLLPLYRGSPLVRLYTRLVSSSARRAHAVIADSECSKRDIVRHLGIPAERVRVVYLAADARYRPVREADRLDAVRAKYRLPTNFLLYLGGFDQRKNARVIVEAFAALPELYRSGYRLALAGVPLGEDSEFFPDPQRRARAAGLPEDAVQFTGWVSEEDKPALYSSATAFLFPSLYEGFGLPPLEAMACGTPVIVSNASSLPEIVGEAGLQVDPAMPSAWAEAIRAVVTDASRRAEMGARGIAQAEKFSWTRAAQETLAAYRLAMG